MDEVERRGLRAEAVAGGDRARRAFERLWKHYYGRILAFARCYRGLPGRDAEDEAAEVLIAAFGALPRYDPARPLEPWIYRIAANRFSRAAGRSRRTIPSDFAVEPVEERGDHVERAAALDLAERCGRAIDGLPEEDRRLALLSFGEGLDSKAVGAALGMPAGTVRWRLHAIRKAVRTAVGE